MSRAVVVFRVGTRACALPVAAVVETMRALPLQDLPGLAEPTLGMAMIRGEPTPVVDAGTLFGAGPSTAARFVTLRVGTRVVALAVDDVIGVRTLDDGAVHPLPPLLAGAASGALERIATLDGELLVVLEEGRTIPDEVLDALEADR